MGDPDDLNTGPGTLARWLDGVLAAKPGSCYGHLAMDSKRQAVIEAVHEVDASKLEYEQAQERAAQAGERLKEAEKKLDQLLGASGTRGTPTVQVQVSIPDDAEPNEEPSKADELWRILRDNPRIDYVAAARAIYGATDKKARKRVGALLSNLRKRRRVSAAGAGVWHAVDETGKLVLPLVAARRAG